MTGFQYLIFINSLNGKALSSYLGIPEETVLSWFDNAALIGASYLETISHITGIDPALISSEVSEIERLRIKQKSLEFQRIYNPRVVSYDHRVSFFGQGPVFAEDAEIADIRCQISEIQRNQFDELFKEICNQEGRVATLMSMIEVLDDEDREDLFERLIIEEEHSDNRPEST